MGPDYSNLHETQCCHFTRVVYLVYHAYMDMHNMLLLYYVYIEKEMAHDRKKRLVSDLLVIRNVSCTHYPRHQSEVAPEQELIAT